MDPADQTSAKIEPTKRQSAAVAASDDMRRKSDERLRALLKNLEGTSDRGKPMELNDVFLGIIHRLDDGTAKLKAVNDHLLAIQSEMKRPASRGFTGYLLALCIGVAAYIAWQSYGQATKQIIAAKAPELGWSPEAKQMIASTMQQLGWTKPSAGPENAATTPQAAPVAQAGSETVASTSNATAASSLGQQQAQKVEADIAAVKQTVEQRLAGVRATVEQLAVGQDQVLREIAKLHQEILEKIPAPAPPRPVAAPARKPTPPAPPSPAPMPLQLSPHP
jgi:hypothetical protein